MSVYVDPLRVWGGNSAPRCFRFKPSCHMYADDLADLHSMARRIGLKTEWFQNNIDLPHYDLTPGRRITAVRCGAIEVDLKHLVDFMRRRRNGNNN